MDEKEKRKRLVLLITGVVTLLLVVIGATYAYFQAQLGTGGNVEVGATTGTTDHLTFNISDIDITNDDNKVVDENKGSEILINANQTNFGEEGTSLGDGVNLNAYLKAGDSKVASYTYNMYLDITKNELEYTSYKYNDKVISFKTKEEKEEAEYGIEIDDEYLYLEDLTPIPELVLVVQKPDESYVENIGKLTKSEITIEGKSIPCFDITEVKDFIAITNDYPIDANEEINGEAEHDWKVSVIFKNLNTDQELNTGKSFEAKLSIQSEKINYLDFTNNADCNEYDNCEFTDYRNPGRLYGGIEEGHYVGTSTKIKNVSIVNYIANEEELNSVENWDLSSSKDKSIMGWLKENEDPEVPYNLYIGSNLKEGEK